MIGSIVGVGVFGLPFTLAKSGFLPGVLLILFVSGMVILLQLMYAEVAVQTKGRHRLVGYVRNYLGDKWGWIAMIALSASLWGAMLAYVILGGGFLETLLSPMFGGSSSAYSVMMAVLAGALMYKGLKFVAKVDVILIGVLLFLFAFIFLASLPHVSLKNLMFVDLDNFLLPYGVALFSLSGFGAVPEMKELLGKNVKMLPVAVIFGMLTITIIYLSFSFSVLGVSGVSTTEAAFDGLVSVLGPTFSIVSSLLGSLTILSIYTILGIVLIDTFKHDLGLPRFPVWLVVSTVPVILFLLGFREFITIISFIGTVFGGCLGIIIVLMYEKMRRSPVCATHHCLNLPKVLSWLIIGVFVLGILFELSSLF